jgi:hypothetical protein
MEELAAFLPIVVIFLVAALVVAWACRRESTILAEGNRSGVRRGQFAALLTAICVFIVTYLSAWVAYRPFVALGRDRPLQMLGDDYQLHSAIEQYSKEHGRYPDSLKDAVPTNSALADRSDPWERPYQYAKTDKGYRLFSLGRDGKPGGVGLDADFDLPNPPRPYDVPVPFTQFLFEGGGSGTLFIIALAASMCAGWACFLLAGSPRPDFKAHWPGVLLSVLATTIVAFIVVGFLMAIYLVGNSH